VAFQPGFYGHSLLACHRATSDCKRCKSGVGLGPAPLTPSTCEATTLKDSSPALMAIHQLPHDGNNDGIMVKQIWQLTNPSCVIDKLVTAIEVRICKWKKTYVYKTWSGGAKNYTGVTEKSFAGTVQCPGAVELASRTIQCAV
jgi:hypothetical protein